ncbi:MAG: nucleotide sugar dehydrogenase [Endomicrobia bacterium]|nr:nucleotide sugar dehydrogenase [Endomicrobiia bacterium]
MINIKNLNSKILNKEAKIGVIGLGYVGLPLALLISNKGFKTYGFDIDDKKIKSLKEKKSYISHIPSEKIKESLNFYPTGDFSKLKICDIVIICVPTPTTDTNEPDLSAVVSTSEVVKKYLHKGEVVILVSTTYPTTTRDVVKPILEKSGLKCGKDFFLAFSPEREDPGNKVYSTENIPKLVGGVDRISTEVVCLFFSQIVNKVIPVSSAEVAEASKVLENTFRAVNIALVNELKMLFDRMGIDIWEVIDAASTKPFGFMTFYPGPGWGGHCIPVDPFYLSYIAKKYDFSTKFIELAGQINIRMPEFVVEKVSEALNQRKKVLNGAKILVLGLSYKKDIGDLRESPSLRVMELLERKGSKVDYNDPYIEQIPPLRKYKFLKRSVELNEKNLKRYDCVIIITDHSCYDYKMILENSNLIVDTRNAIRRNLPNYKNLQKVVQA